MERTNEEGFGWNGTMENEKGRGVDSLEDKQRLGTGRDGKRESCRSCGLSVIMADAVHHGSARCRGEVGELGLGWGWVGVGVMDGEMEVIAGRVKRVHRCGASLGPAPVNHPRSAERLHIKRPCPFPFP